MREGLAEYLATELCQQVHQFLFDYYCQPLKELENQVITEVHKTCVIEAFHHGQNALDTEKFFEWFNGIFLIFHRAAMWQFLLLLQEECTNLSERRLGPEHPNTRAVRGNLERLDQTMKQ